MALVFLDVTVDGPLFADLGRLKSATVQLLLLLAHLLVSYDQLLLLLVLHLPLVEAPLLRASRLGARLLLVAV